MATIYTLTETDKNMIQAWAAKTEEERALVCPFDNVSACTNKGRKEERHPLCAYLIADAVKENDIYSAYCPCAIPGARWWENKVLVRVTEIIKYGYIDVTGLSYSPRFESYARNCGLCDFSYCRDDDCRKIGCKIIPAFFFESFDGEKAFMAEHCLHYRVS